MKRARLSNEGRTSTPSSAWLLAGLTTVRRQAHGLRARDGLASVQIPKLLLYRCLSAYPGHKVGTCLTKLGADSLYHH